MFSPLVALALALASALVPAAARVHALPAAQPFGLASPVVIADEASEYRHLGSAPPPHGLPAIRSVWLSTTNIRCGTTVSGRVETSDNVNYVEARVEYRSAALHKDGEGRFSLSYHVPWWLPPWTRHAYTLQVVARTVDGVEAWHSVPIVVR